MKNRLQATDVFKHKQHAGRRKGRKGRFCPWWPWPLTFDLDLQTRPIDGPNTSSLWIWRKSVQRFPRYFIHKQKNTDWRRQKQNLPQFTAVHCAVYMRYTLWAMCMLNHCLEWYKCVLTNLYPTDSGWTHLLHDFSPDGGTHPTIWFCKLLAVTPETKVTLSNPPHLKSNVI